MIVLILLSMVGSGRLQRWLQWRTDVTLAEDSEKFLVLFNAFRGVQRFRQHAEALGPAATMLQAPPSMRVWIHYSCGAIPLLVCGSHCRG